MDSILKLFKWLEIRGNHGGKFPESLVSMKIDAAKSSLFRRLLENKPVYTFPPPLEYGYPWYLLIEAGEAKAVDVWETEEKKLSINHSLWDLESKTSDVMGNPVYFVTYPKVPGRFKVFLIEDKQIVKIWRVEWLNPELRSVMDV